MRRDGGTVFPVHANTGDPNGPTRGLSANEIAGALISMMARSTTLQRKAGYIDARPPTEQLVEIFLLRTAGPYIRVKSGMGLIEAREVGLPQKSGRHSLHECKAEYAFR